MAIVTKRRTS